MLLKAEGVRRDFLRNRGATNVFTAVAPTFFTLAEGELTEILGRSGSGKTTFINMLSGLLTPTDGRVLLDGADLYAVSDSERALLRNRHIGVIPQGHTGLSGLTVLENVLAPAAMYSSSGDKRGCALELLEAMGISDLADVFSNELSGGENRRMSIARALINDPEIIIADEPTGDLDEESTSDVLRLLRKCADEGASVLMVTHDADAVRMADRVYRMDRGVLSKDAPDARPYPGAERTPAGM